MYNKVAEQFLDECVVSTIPLDSDVNDVAYIHESGPLSPGVPVQEGDILGLLLRTERAAFVPYLYHSVEDDNIGSGLLMEFQSYYFPRQGPRDVQLTLGKQNRTDFLVPLLALEICE